MDAGQIKAFAGTATLYGHQAPWRCRLDAAGSFDWRIEGPLGEGAISDGRHALAVDWTGASRPLELFELDVRRAVVAALAGAPRDALEAVAPRLGAVVEAGRTTRTVRYPAPGGAETWTAEARDGEPEWTPFRLTKAVSDEVLVDIAIDAVTASGNGSAIRVEPSPEPEDYRFATEKSAELEVRRGPHGHLLVRGAVGDVDPGWYILDSGASNSTVTPRVAHAAGLQVVGSGIIASVLGPAKTPVFAAASLRVGPLTLLSLPLVGFDLDPFADAFGVEVDGVLGFDVFRRSRIRVEVATPSVRLLPPAVRTDDAPGTRWLPITFNLQHPTVEGRINGRAARFRADLGMGGDATALLHRGAADRLGIRLDPEAETIAMGAGSASTGRLESLDLAGKEWRSPVYVLPDGDQGVFHDPYVDATIGQAVLGAFELEFDYAGARLGLRPL